MSDQDESHWFALWRNSRRSVAAKLAPVARLEERPPGEPGSTPGGSLTYRYRNPERRREYMKNLMRARRAR